MKPLRLALCLSLPLAACGGESATPADASSATDAAADAPAAPAPVAMTASGPVRGFEREGVKVFNRIPFAAPPVGPLRFAPPAPAAPWTTPLDGTVAGSVCAQRAGLLAGGMAMGSEDCLHVNVTTPSLTGSRPVMVWIHGGGFLTGSGSEGTYEGTRLVTEGDVVLVTVNYRLGALGFLSHPALAPAGMSSGNWGLLDQQAALRWVRDNARAFGGDPARVTIFGESAGGMSVGLHLAAPGSRGLFHRAIIQSGPVPRLPSRERADAIGRMAAQTLGCTSGDVAACLRNAPLAALPTAVESTNEPGGIFYQERGFVYMPTFDGATFPEQPLATMRAGRHADVPLMAGTNTDEATIFHNGLLGPAVSNDAEYRAALARATTVLGITPAQAMMIVERYPSSRYPTPNDALMAVTNDGIFACATRYVARLHTAARRAARVYRFDQAPARVAVPGLGVFHAAELSFVFGTRSTFLGDSSSAPELATAMRRMWTRFAASGDPEATPAWPAWSPTADQRYRLAPARAMENADPDGRCAFWTSLYDTL